MSDINEAWSALVKASVEWADHMDQWDKFTFNTKYGRVYVRIGRATEWPNEFAPVDHEGNFTETPEQERERLKLR